MLKVALHQQKQDLETQVQGPGTSAPPLPTQIGPQGSLIENQVSETLVLSPLEEVTTVRFRKETEFNQTEC